MRWFLAAIATLFVLFAFAACGGDGDDDDGADAPAASRTEDAGDDGEDNDADATEDDAGDDNGGDSGDAEGARNAARRFVDATFRAEYEISGGSIEEGFGDGTMVLYKDGTDRLRIDISGEQDGEPFEAIVIQDGDETVFCVKGAAEFSELFGIEGDGVCLSTDPTGGAGFLNLEEELAALEDEDLNVLDSSTRTIAGEEANCYTTLDDSGETEACISDDGVLLYVSSEDGTIIEATEVDDDVSDSDFEAPYEIREIPGLGGQE